MTAETKTGEHSSQIFFARDVARDIARDVAIGCSCGRILHWIL